MFAIYLLGIALGYLLLAIITTYVVVKQAGKRGATKRGKVIAAFITLFIFWLIPFWDWIPTVIYHNHLCKTEAGMKIYRSVERVEGFLGDGAWPLNLGYEYADVVTVSNNVVRYRRNPDKSSSKPWIEEAVNKPSIYGFKSERVRLKWNTVKLQYTTYVIATGETLGTFTDFASTAADPNVSMSEWRKPWLADSSCFSETENYLARKNQMIMQSLKIRR